MTSVLSDGEEAVDVLPGVEEMFGSAMSPFPSSPTVPMKRMSPSRFQVRLLHDAKRLRASR